MRSRSGHTHTHTHNCDQKNNYCWDSAHPFIYLWEALDGQKCTLWFSGAPSPPTHSSLTISLPTPLSPLHTGQKVLSHRQENLKEPSSRAGRAQPLGLATLVTTCSFCLKVFTVVKPGAKGSHTLKNSKSLKHSSFFQAIISQLYMVAISRLANSI